MNIEEKYKLNGVSLNKIRNKNEVRVIHYMPSVLEEFLDYHPDPLDVEDIYALTLNRLPPRYTQQGSIILREEVTEHEIKETIRHAIEVVIKNPKH